MQQLKDKFREVVSKAAAPRSSVVIWLEKTFKLDKRRITPEIVQRDMEQLRKK